MEIVLGILLLFGAFSLGTLTSESPDTDMPTPHVESDGAVQPAQALNTSVLPKCQPSGSDRHYRDLTVPLTKPPVQQSTSTRDTEANDVWDE